MKFRGVKKCVKVDIFKRFPSPPQWLGAAETLAGVFARGASARCRLGSLWGVLSAELAHLLLADHAVFDYDRNPDTFKSKGKTKVNCSAAKTAQS